MTNNISEIEIILQTSDGPRPAGKRSRILFLAIILFTCMTYITMILNQTNTHMVLLLSGITLRQHIMLTSAIEGGKKKKNENAQQSRDSGRVF